jgi:DNA polymerase I-like protein with 3'-5' exonuclease and polymerase domains
VPAAILSFDNYVTILDEDVLNEWIAKLKKAAVFAFDTETDSLDNISANLVGLSFAIEPGVAAYVPVAHDYLDAPAQISRDRALELLKDLLEDEKVLKVGRTSNMTVAFCRITALSCAVLPLTPCWNPTRWIVSLAVMIWTACLIAG